MDIEHLTRYRLPDSDDWARPPGSPWTWFIGSRRGGKRKSKAISGEEVRRMYDSSPSSMAAIAEKLGVSRSTLYRTLEASGIQRGRSPKRARSGGNEHG